MIKTAIQYVGKGKTFIKVKVLDKARKGNYIIAGDMTEGEALILANGLINAVTMKMQKEKRL